MLKNKLLFPADVSKRDPIAQIEVAQILSVLPESHPVRALFARGRPTIELQRALYDERPDLAGDLLRTHRDWQERLYRVNPVRTVQPGPLLRERE